MLSSHLRLGLPSDLFFSDFSNNILYAFLSAPMRATFPAHLMYFYLIALIVFVET